MLHALMLGAGESYLGALAVELGHGDVALAILTTVPMWVGAMSQLLAGPLSRAFGSRKRLVVAAAFGQALTQLIFVAIAAFASPSLAALLAAKCLYWSCGALVDAPWGAWMAALVSGEERIRYFSRRTALNQGGVFFAFVLSGLLLNAHEWVGPALWAFAIIHSVAFFARVSSAIVLALQYDPDPHPAQRDLKRVLRYAIYRSKWSTPFYYAALMLGAYVAVPFFTPYMLRTLGFSYGEYALLTAVPFVSKVASAWTCFSLASRFGLRALIIVGGLGVALVSLLWAVSANFWVLVVAQLLSGLCWTAVEFAYRQLAMAGAGAPWRLEFLSVAGSLVGCAQVLGSVAGGFLLTGLGLTYPALFAVSAVMRAGPLLSLLPALPKQAPRLNRVWARVISVKPSGGFATRAVIEVDSDRDPEAPLE